MSVEFSDQTVTDCVCRSLGIDRQSVTDDLMMGGVPQWDSLGHINLMTEIERCLGLSLAPRDIEKLTTVKAIRQFIAEHPAECTGAHR